MGCCIVLVCLFWLIAACGPARAAPPPGDANAMLFSADELQSDEELGLVVAKGHVEISQGLRTLLADTVTYNQRTDTVTASGNVSLLEPTGEILFADFMELTNRFEEGFMKDIRALLSDRARLAANTGRRSGGNRLELRRGVYSPCDLCRDDPTQPPLWQLRAEQIVRDEQQHIVEYRDATLEIGGVPVLYLPYLSHPDPTIKRQSGFLAPTFGNSSTLVNWDPTGRAAPGTLVRGHAFGSGVWDIDENWRSGFDLRRSTDQTYLRRFPFGGTENFLTNRAYGERFDQRSFLGINSYAFHTLRQSTN